MSGSPPAAVTADLGGQVAVISLLARPHRNRRSAGPGVDRWVHRPGWRLVRPLRRAGLLQGGTACPFMFMVSASLGQVEGCGSDGRSGQSVRQPQPFRGAR
jgi:hypothetical protein